MLVISIALLKTVFFVVFVVVVFQIVYVLNADFV